MFRHVPPQVWLLLAIGAVAYLPARYVIEHVSGASAREADLGHRTGDRLVRNIAILAGLAALALFIFTPAAARFAKAPSFVPLLLSAIGIFAIGSVVRGFTSGRVEPMIRGVTREYEREHQPRRYWASMAWNGAMGCLMLGMAYPSYKTALAKPLEDRCFGDSKAASSSQKIAACDELLKTDARSANRRAGLLAERGNGYYVAGNYRQARQDYVRSIAADSNQDYVHYNLGLVQEALGNEPDAMDEYSAALKLAPNNFDALMARAAISLREKQFNHAVTDLTAAQRLKPNDPAPFAERGLVHALSGEVRMAEADFASARRLDPSNIVAMRGQAQLALNRHDAKGALGLLTTLLARWPDDEWALWQRAELYREIGDESRMAADYATLDLIRSR